MSNDFALDNQYSFQMVFLLMSELRVLTAAQQVAAYLREELIRGRWGGRIPGGDRLAAELGVGRNTVEGSLKELETEGLLVPQGAGRRRKVVVQEGFKRSRLRLVILPYEETDRKRGYMLDLQFRLIEAGHTAGFSTKALMDLGLDAKRVARLVQETEADAWVVFGGPREVLEWFAAQSVPAFAVFGRRRTVRIAGTGPDKLPALLEMLRELVGLGHRRIVLLMREEHRKPQPGLFSLSSIRSVCPRVPSICRSGRTMPKGSCVVWTRCSRSPRPPR